MNTDFVKYGDQELPKYLGYGILVEETVKHDDDKLTAKYVYEHDNYIAHSVELSKRGCDFLTYLNEEMKGASFHRDLKTAVTHEFSQRTFNQCPCFQLLANKTKRTGNFHIEFEEDTRDGRSIAYYPAGKLVSFIIPVKKIDQPGVDLFKKLQDADIAGPYIKTEGTLFSYQNKHDLVVEDIFILRVQVPVAFMIRTAKTIRRTGLILPDRRFQVLVFESTDGIEFEEYHFPGDAKFPFYSIYPQQQSPELIEYYKKKQFRLELDSRLLEDLRRFHRF